MLAAAESIGNSVLLGASLNLTSKEITNGRKSTGAAVKPVAA
jgi:hypothetical protein